MCNTLCTLVSWALVSGNSSTSQKKLKLTNQQSAYQVPFHYKIPISPFSTFHPTQLITPTLPEFCTQFAFSSPMAFLLSWRYVYFLTIGLRFLVALSDSYIHPDEHFQSLEVVLAWLGYNVNAPWEFTSPSPARSYAPLVLFFWPIMKTADYFGFQPLQIWYICRLVLMVLSWMVTDWCLHKMLPTKQERIKAIYFTLTLYVTLVYQSHCFSNSVETVLVVAAVYIINELRFILGQDASQQRTGDLVKLAGTLGFLVAFGTFNRITFPCFFVLPGYYLAGAFWKWKTLPLVAAATFAVTSATCIILDTAIFQGLSFSELLQHPWSHGLWVITPLNSLLYNTNTLNLAKHGIHPWYTHILANLPQLFGPGLLLLFFRFRNRYWKTTPFLSAASGILFLSLVPHQELRFLTPIVPLLCCCFDLSLGYDGDAKEASKLSSIIMGLWFAFNILMGVLMGIFHQGGVVPALDYLQTLHLQGVTQVWWRTYSPPTWMLADKQHQYQFISLHGEYHGFELDDTKTNYVIDAMGSDIRVVDALIKNLDTKVLLVTPIASFSTHFDVTHFNKTWSTPFHLDLDHLDWSDPRTLQPGLAVYELI